MAWMLRLKAGWTQMGGFGGAGKVQSVGKGDDVVQAA